MLSNEPVSVSSGVAIVEVKPQGVSKGGAVERILLQTANEGAAPDFILCIGDDRSDEDMFAAIDNVSFSPHHHAAVRQTLPCPPCAMDALQSKSLHKEELCYANSHAASLMRAYAWPWPAQTRESPAVSEQARGSMTASINSYDLLEMHMPSSSIHQEPGIRDPSRSHSSKFAWIYGAVYLQVFACTVGQKPSKAPFYMNDTEEVAMVLARLAGTSLTSSRTSSMSQPRIPQEPITELDEAEAAFSTESPDR